MSWAEKMKEFGGADLLFLSEDGEAIDFCVLGDPELIESAYKGKQSNKIAAPVITAEGFRLFIMGMRLFRRICKHEAEFDSRIFRAIRHGEQEDPRTTYELQVIEDKVTFDMYQEYAEKEYTDEAMADALESAREVMKK